MKQDVKFHMLCFKSFRILLCHITSWRGIWGTITSSLDQQFANLTSLTQQISETWIYPQPPTPPMHYDYTPKFYHPQSYEPSPPPPQTMPISQGPSLEDLVKSISSTTPNHAKVKYGGIWYVWKMMLFIPLYVFFC